VNLSSLSNLALVEPKQEPSFWLLLRTSTALSNHERYYTLQGLMEVHSSQAGVADALTCSDSREDETGEKPFALNRCRVRAPA
jgi:hypothetical protein